MVDRPGARRSCARCAGRSHITNMAATVSWYWCCTPGSGRSNGRRRRRGDRARAGRSDRATADKGTARHRTRHLARQRKLIRMLAVNRDIMIRTAALISVWLFFAAQGARSGDITLAANAVPTIFCWSAHSFSMALPMPPSSSAARPMARATGPPSPARSGW